MTFDQPIGVAFGHFALPAQRLADHFDWNDAIYRDFSARVFVVVDKPYPVPDYAECVLFPSSRLPVVDGRTVFATTRTRNAGVRAALDAGCDPIIVTDSCMCFERESWETMLAVGSRPRRSAVIPVCRMSYSNDRDRRAERFEDAALATGTVSMLAEDWRMIRYNEKQFGYGCDDGRFEIYIRTAGIQIRREGIIYHMAHVEGAEQREFHGRTDHWNRASGFNPENSKHNARQT
jgi:hypothetical protein